MIPLVSSFQRNIGTKGRIARGSAAIVCLIAGFLILRLNPWFSFFLFASSAFLAFEAFRGWCALRACGVRTKF